MLLILLFFISGSIALGQVSITITPHDPPVTIPNEGGDIYYDILVINNTANEVQGDVWTAIGFPGGGSDSPVARWLGYSIDPYDSLGFTDCLLVIPGSAPTGWYTYRANVGQLTAPPTVVDYDQFQFLKLGPFGPSDILGQKFSLPTEFGLVNIFPNPFNAQATVEISLPSESELTLNVYNLQGRLVATLAEESYPAGEHQFSFNASRLASGMYIIHAQVPGQLSATQRVTLLK